MRIVLYVSFELNLYEKGTIIWGIIWRTFSCLTNTYEKKIVIKGSLSGFQILNHVVAGAHCGVS